MQKVKIILCFYFFAVLTFSCSNGEEKKLLVGDWNGAEWLVGGNPSDYDAKQVHFSFQADGGYNSNFGGDKEKGTYILRDNNLYTTAEGQLEIKVKIQKLTKDSLVFDMNRSGQDETLTLIRK